MAICSGGRFLGQGCTCSRLRADGVEYLVERIEAAEIEFPGGLNWTCANWSFERKHQRAFEVVLGAQQFFFADWRPFF